MSHGKRFIARNVAFVFTFLFLLLSQLPAKAQNEDAPGLPAVIQELEGSFHGTWTLHSGQYSAQWNNGARAVLTVGSFTPQSVVLNRTDTSDSVSRGLTAVYTGQIASTSDRIENGHVTWTWPGVPGYPATGTWSASWSSMKLKIHLDGKDITGTTPTVVVGQQINLRMLLSNDTTCMLPMWSVKGLTVAGFNALPSFSDPMVGSALPTDFTRSSETEQFYWVRGGVFSVTASCISGSQIVSTQASFNVVMPSITAVKIEMGKIDIVKAGKDTFLRFGTSSNGINFEAKQPPRTGIYQWVQTLSRIQAIFHTPTGNQSTSVANALDTYYPYNNNIRYPNGVLSVNDSPGAKLVSSLFTEISEIFSARMYLMWNPRIPSNCVLPSEAGVGTCTSISIPLGYVDWQWTGAAQYKNKQWKLVAGSTSRKANPFLRSSVFPFWLQRFKSGCYPNCGRAQTLLDPQHIN